MPHHIDEFDDEYWDGEDRNLSDAEDDLADDDEQETIPCPHCGRPIHEDSERCPDCETYVSHEEAPPTRKPVWILIGAAAVLAVVYVWVRFNE